MEQTYLARMTPDELKAAVAGADADQRLALAKGGITLAILQEQVRMGFSDDEVASVLAMKDDNSLNEEMKFLWLKKLARYREALEENLSTGDEEG